MNMPKVISCDAPECAYNLNNICHALAITVGNGSIAHCDTFCSSSIKGGDPVAVGCVGACKCVSCLHNLSMECQASEICVGHEGADVNCLTFTAT